MPILSIIIFQCERLGESLNYRYELRTILYILLKLSFVFSCWSFRHEIIPVDFRMRKASFFPLQKRLLWFLICSLGFWGAIAWGESQKVHINAYYIWVSCLALKIENWKGFWAIKDLVGSFFGFIIIKVKYKLPISIDILLQLIPWK